MVSSKREGGIVSKLGIECATAVDVVIIFTDRFFDEVDSRRLGCKKIIRLVHDGCSTKEISLHALYTYLVSRKMRCGENKLFAEKYV